MNSGEDMGEDIMMHPKEHKQLQEEVQHLHEPIKIHHQKEDKDYDHGNEEALETYSIIDPIDRDVDFRRGG